MYSITMAQLMIVASPWNELDTRLAICDRILCPSSTHCSWLSKAPMRSTVIFWRKKSCNACGIRGISLDDCTYTDRRLYKCCVSLIIMGTINRAARVKVNPISANAKNMAGMRLRRRNMRWLYSTSGFIKYAMSHATKNGNKTLLM